MGNAGFISSTVGGLRFRVASLGFRVWGLGVWGFGSRGLGFKGLGFKA